MTRRAWVILAVGALAVAASGAFAVVAGRSSPSFNPSASWGAFTAPQWKLVRERVAHRGFEPTSAKVVSAAPMQNGRPFALVSATRKGGHTCFMAVRGVDVAAPVCRLTKPLLVLTMPDRYDEPASVTGPARSVPMTEIIGLARRDVTGIVTSSTSAGRKWVQGLPLLYVPGGWAFGGGYRDVTTLVAHNRRGNVLARLQIAVGPR